VNNNSLITAFRSSTLLIRRIWRQIPLLTSLWLGIPLALGLVVVPGYSAQKQLIDLFMVAYADSVHSPASWGAMIVRAWPFLSVITGVAVIKSLLNALQNVIDAKFRDQASLTLQSEVYRKAANVPLERLDQAEYYDRLSRAKSVAGEDIFGILQNIVSALRLLFELIGLLAVCWLAGPVVDGIVAVVFAISLSIRLEADLVKRRLNRDLTRAGREAGYLRETIVKPATVRDMRIAGSMPYLLDKWSTVMKQSLGLRMNANRREIRRGIIVSTVQIAGLFGVIAWMAIQLKSGHVTAGTFVVVFQALRHVYGISSRIAFPIGKIYIQSAKLLDVTEFLQEAEERGAGSERGAAHEPGLMGPIVFEGVTYRYPGQVRPVLQGIDLVLKPGETVALVGDNGAGKSTLIKLLFGLYRPTSGRITWDGVNLTGIGTGTDGLCNSRKSMSAVFQDFVRYETSVRDNVTFGAPEAAVADGRVREALRIGGAEALAQLPGGLDARVGLLQEDGRELSGGQWQRLAISRAALRDSRLLVLDEPTSALDPQHEKDLYESFRELGRGRTVLFVSHRLGWARFADRIVVLRAGRIVEEGTHDELLAAGGDYAAMFKAQAAWYR
jgi:ATP-binding cassette subfamily B protein